MQRIRLTEDQLNRIVMNTAQRVIKEGALGKGIGMAAKTFANGFKGGKYAQYVAKAPEIIDAAEDVIKMLYNKYGDKVGEIISAMASKFGNKQIATESYRRYGRRVNENLTGAAIGAGAGAVIGGVCGAGGGAIPGAITGAKIGDTAGDIYDSFTGDDEADD